MGAHARSSDRRTGYRAACGAKVDVADGVWPPEGGDERACPVCARDTGAPWG